VPRDWNKGIGHVLEQGKKKHLTLEKRGLDANTKN
jgi:hypothetical protein